MRSMASFIGYLANLAHLSASPFEAVRADVEAEVKATGDPPGIAIELRTLPAVPMLHASV